MPALNIWLDRDHRLTGRTRYRRGVEKIGFRKHRQVLIVQVEEAYVNYPAEGPAERARNLLRWRDLQITDLAPEFVVDLG